MTFRTLLSAIWIAGLLVAAGSAEDWEAMHREMLDEVGNLASEYFGEDSLEDTSLPPPLPFVTRASFPSMIVVGFTGGVQRKDSRASGVALLRNSLEAHAGGHNEVLPLTFNNFHWRQAVSQVLESVRAARREADFLPGLDQPLIVAYGHSWGAGAIRKFAQELRKDGVEISLAIYIDSISWGNPRVPDNVRYAANFYQRAGILKGFPFRGKSKLIPEDPEATHILGNYRVTPRTSIGRWSWNIFKPLLYKQHHRIAHDPRLEKYLMEIVNRNLALLDRTLAASELAD